MTTIVDITEGLTREQFCLSLFIDLAKAFHIVDQIHLIKHVLSVGLSQ